MARYCFYCGRELATGEKCTCRSRSGGTQSHGTSGQSQGTTGQAHSAGNQSRSTSGQAHKSTSQQSQTRSGDHARTTQFKSQAQSTRKGPSFWSRFQAFTNKKPPYSGFAGKRMVDSAAILAGVSQYLRYLTRPVDSIRQAVQYLNPHRLLVLMLVHAAIGGFGMLRIDQLGTLDLLMQLTQIQVTAHPFLTGLFLFLQGVGLTLVFDWLLILVTHLTLQYMFRAPFALSRVAASFVPVIYYQALFGLLALLSLTLVPIASLLTLAAGLAMTVLVLFLVIRQLTSFDENRCFVLIMFVIVVFTSLVSLVINLAMPVLNLLLEQSLPL